ncbi:hypothetical protein C8Q79DRAFT_1012333 [Trametes meyenii]|nr:hypothetical protein C8Q79DRAFT_1012333 [Trametes meyenii]
MLFKRGFALLIVFTAARGAVISSPNVATLEDVVQDLAERPGIAPTVVVASSENIDSTSLRTSQPGQSHHSDHADAWGNQRPPLATARGADLPSNTLLSAYPRITRISGFATSARRFPRPRDEDDASTSSAAEASTSIESEEQTARPSSTFTTVSRSPTPPSEAEDEGEDSEEHKKSEDDSGRNSPYARSLLIIIGILSALLFITLAMLAVLMKRRIYGNSPGRYHELRAQRSRAPNMEAQDRPDTMYSATSEIPLVHHQPSEPPAEGPGRVDSFRSRRTSVSSASRYSQ